MKNPTWVLFLSLVMILAAIPLFNACTASTTTPTSAPATSAPPQVIELTLAHQYNSPNSHVTTMEAWIKYIHEKTNNRVHIKPFWGGSLTSHEHAMDEIAKGVADIGYGSPYDPKGSEIHAAMYNFMAMCPSAEVSARVSMELIKEFTEWRLEYEGRGLKILGYATPQSYLLQTAKPINKMDDIKGKSFMAVIPHQAVFKELGASSTMMPPGDVYISIQKGIIDGVDFPADTIKVFKFAEVAKYVAINIPLLAPQNPIEYININSWNKLPPDIQKTFEESVDYLISIRTKAFEEERQAGINFGKAQGVQFVELPKAEVDKFYAVVEKVAWDSAKSVDALGKPGTKIMNEVKRLIEKYSK